MELNSAMFVLLDVCAKGSGNFDGEPRLFQAFARGGLGRRLASFHLPAGKFPQAGQSNACRALTDQKPTAEFNDGHRDRRRLGHHVPLSSTL
jgi:hypothetical protein